MTRSFDQYVASHPDRIAIIAPDGRTFTYADVARESAVASRLLESVGYSEGDVVCALLPNGPDIMLVQRGILQMPVYFSTINWHLTPAEIAHILSDSAVRLFFTNRELEQNARAALDLAGLPHDRLVIVDGPASDASSLAARSAGLPEGRPHNTKAGARRLYTSGTTGKPKAVLRPLPGISPQQAAAAAITRAALYRVDHEDGTYLSVAPLYHAAPLSYADQSLDLGHTVVIAPKWHPQLALDLLRAHHVTWTYMVPLMFQELLALPAADRGGITTIRSIVHTAAPCPPHIKRGMIDWLGPALMEVYGGTEGSATSITSEEWLEHPGSVGRARPGVTLEIRDDAGELLPAREIGHIYFANPGLPFVYANDLEKTQKSRIGDSITLGDIGYLDEEGYLYLCDRVADTVISGGVNIYPAEIEHALKEVPWVSDACIIGVPDSRWGEALLAVVVRRETRPAGTDDDHAAFLIEELREKIAGFKIPRSFDFVSTLPYSEAGKLLRKQVRDARTPSAVV